MAVYMLNLGFSSFDRSNGSFSPYQASDVGLAQSLAWFQYQGSTPPQIDAVQPYSPLQQEDWKNSVAPSQSPFSINVGDYVMLRVFRMPTDDPNNLDPLNLRISLVFGYVVNPASGNDQQKFVQAPLQLNGYPRPVVDVDNSPGTSWPLAPTSETFNGVARPSTWCYYLGRAYAAANQPNPYYSFNIGVTAYDNNPGSPTYQVSFFYGHDPTVKVKG
jgi:hypothetical protein